MASTLSKTVLILLTLLCACSQSEEPSGRAVYDIPFSYSPDTGFPNLLKKTKKIDSAEFAVTLTEKYLVDNIEGFQAQLEGYSHEIYVIVSVFDPDIHSNWKPSEQQVKVWDEMWKMEGEYSAACMLDEPDTYTGYYRYFRDCSFEPIIRSRSFFVLMDRIPNASKPRPSHQKHIKGHCSLHEDFILKRDTLIQSCIFSGRTKWGDKFQFRLHSDNIYVLDDVEAHIAGLLTQWKR
jgi:hypothetical protein